MGWWNRAGTTISRSDEAPTEPEETAEAEASAEPPSAPAAKPTGSAAASIFAMIVLALAVALALWAPWREDRLTLSDYGARPDAAPKPTAAAAPAASAPVGGASAATAAPPAARPGEQSRPVGLPIQRTDWIIVRDYVANGGPGNTGAIDVGVVGNRDALGAPVYATHDGVVRVLRNNRVYGNLVAVKNGRWSTTYGYLDRVLVNDGQAVRRGEQIGTLGRSGQATGPQVNYQVWELVGDAELNRNPMDYIEPR
jgi:murein DD-endopeptidase MepM/ murein hydrolase activator NlpD